VTTHITQSPEDELKQKQEELKDAQDNVSSLQADIKTLQVKIAEFQQATAGYETFYNTATKQLEDAKVKIEEKSKMAKSVIPESIAKNIDEGIQKQITDLEETLITQKTEVDNAHTALTTTITEASTAEGISKDKQFAYESLKKQPKDTEAALKEVQKLLDEAEKAHDNDKHDQMYLLVQIAKEALTDKIEILKLDKYKETLMEAKNEAEEKKRDATEKKSKAEQQAANLSELTKNYDAAIASKRTNLLKKLKEVKPTAV
jgi:predicted  nucleic acid-binding Zn-ribbon protein